MLILIRRILDIKGTPNFPEDSIYFCSFQWAIGDHAVSGASARRYRLNVIYLNQNLFVQKMVLPNCYVVLK